MNTRVNLSLMSFKQASIFALCFCFCLISFDTSAQFGKKLRKKVKNALSGDGGEINKDKLPGPYFTSNIPLGVFVNGGTPSTQDFFMQETNGRPTFTTVKGKRTGCILALKTRNVPVLSNGDQLYQSTNTEFYFDVEGNGESMKRPKSVRILHLKKEDVYLFYGQDAPNNDDPLSNKEGGSEGFIKDHSKIQIFYVLAATAELLEEWNSKKGLERIYTAEDGVKAAYLKDMASTIADVRMPKAGKMHQNTALLNKVTGQLSAQMKRDGTTLKRVVITANNWEIVKNKVTGEILYRHIWGYVADSSPERGEISCMVFGFYYTEKYQGNGNYAEGSGKVDCCSQDAKYGPYIDCDNIDK